MTDTSVPDWATETALLNTWHQMASRRATAARRKPARGVDGLNAEAFELRKHFHCAEIARILRRSDKHEAASSMYRFAPLIEQERETEPGKLRRIYIPRIRDQIVIRSLYRTLSTAMQKNGLRGGLENPQAVARRVIFSRQNGRRYVARFDIRGFYDAIAHPLLLDLVKSMAPDPLSQQLIQQLIEETPHRPWRGSRKDDRQRHRGLPTGTAIATLLAELYMHPLDAVGQGLPGSDYLRFVDDILLLGDDEDSLHDGAVDLANTASDLQLELHGRKSRFADFETGFEFLGFGYKDDEVFVAAARIKKWLRRFEVIYRSCLREYALLPPAAQIPRVAAAFNREITGVGSRHIPYYAIVDRVDIYKEVDQILRQIVAGLARRAGRPCHLESCHNWAWRYKKNPAAAARDAEALNGTGFSLLL